MPVFKLCLKIIKKNLPVMLIYVFVFLFVAIAVSSSATKDNQKVVEQAKTNIAFLSQEKSPLIDGFKEQLGEVANFVDIEDNTEALQDALYFRSVEYIVRIPKGFTESFMRGEEVQLDKTIVPNSVSNAYIDLCVNQYFNTAKLYISQNSGISQEALVQHVKKDMSEKAQVELSENTNKVNNNYFSKYYVNYLSYSLLSVIMLGIGTIMMAFNDSDIRKRNACSPLSPNSVTLQYIFANLMFALITWVVMILAYFILNYKNSISVNSLYYMLNTFIFSVCCVTIGFLVGTFVKTQSAISAACNVITLGSCFLSGVFVPQELLSESVLKIASFTPTYWYVKANELISGLTKYDFSHVSTALSYMLVEILFAAAFLVITLTLGKRRSLQQ